MDDNQQKRLEEIQNNIENNYSNWIKLKVLKIEPIKKNYKVHIIDENNYKYCLTYDVIKNAYRRNSMLHKFFRNNIYTKYNIENYLKINNKNFLLISEQVFNATELLIWNCSEHGNFNMCWNAVKNGQECPKCGILKASEIKRNSIEYVKEKFQSQGLILMTDRYINNEQPLSYICNKHKDKGIQYTSLGNVLSRKSCYYCGRERTIQLQTKTHEQFVKEIYNIFGDKYTVIGQYQNSKTHIEIFCNNCNESFYMKPSHLLDGHGCSNCNISRGEERIKLYLQNNKINFISQQKFDGCIGIHRKLPFDFYLPNYNICIEYQGQQHYKPIETFGGQKQFELQQKYDDIKRNYCKNNNINLVEISYKEYNKIEDVLSKSL